MNLVLRRQGCESVEIFSSSQTIHLSRLCHSSSYRKEYFPPLGWVSRKLATPEILNIFFESNSAIHNKTGIGWTEGHPARKLFRFSHFSLCLLSTWQPFNHGANQTHCSASHLIDNQGDCLEWTVLLSEGHVSNMEGRRWPDRPGPRRVVILNLAPS